MTPFYADEWLTIYGGDCRVVLAEMEPESVQCVVTSPPYFGLRDYGIEPSVWGGEAHEHEWGAAIVANAAGYEPGEKARWNHRQNGRGEIQNRILAKDAVDVGWTRKDVKQGQFCRCGAWLGVLGLEPTLELYVAHIVEVFRELRRVLRKDSTLWLNLGDSYAASGKGGHGGSFQDMSVGSLTGAKHRAPYPGFKPKDRMMVPARVALALQADGWWLRDEIVWHKPNPMPSSVTDRTTPAHEMVYLLTKSARYFYDAEAIREEAVSGPSDLRKMAEGRPRIGGLVLASDDPMMAASGRTNIGRKRSVGGAPLRSQTFARDGAVAGHVLPGQSAAQHRSDRTDTTPVVGRNKRSVWTVATAPYPEAHFATFPPKLVEPCILAGSKPGDVILDPFGGSGTVGMVAQSLSRRAVLIDLNPDYLAQCLRRNAQSPLGLETA
jgi:DNA modification methylase